MKRRLKRGRRGTRTEDALSKYWRGEPPPTEPGSAEQADTLLGAIFFSEHKKPVWGFSGNSSPYMSEWLDWVSTSNAAAAQVVSA